MPEMGCNRFALRSPATTALNAVTATGAGSNIDCSRASGTTWYITASSVTSGGTVKIQAAPSDSSTSTDFADLATVTVTANGTTVVTVDEPHAFMHANVTARTDGTYTVRCFKWEGAR